MKGDRQAAARAVVWDLAQVAERAAGPVAVDCDKRYAVDAVRGIFGIWEPKPNVHSRLWRRFEGNARPKLIWPAT